MISFVCMVVLRNVEEVVSDKREWRERGLFG